MLLNLKPERVQFWKQILRLVANVLHAIAAEAEDAGGSDDEPAGKIEE